MGDASGHSIELSSFTFIIFDCWLGRLGLTWSRAFRNFIGIFIENYFFVLSGARALVCSLPSSEEKQQNWWAILKFLFCLNWLLSPVCTWKHWKRVGKPVCVCKSRKLFFYTNTRRKKNLIIRSQTIWTFYSINWENIVKTRMSSTRSSQQRKQRKRKGCQDGR